MEKTILLILNIVGLFKDKSNATSEKSRRKKANSNLCRNRI